MNAELESLVRSYARLSHDVVGRINFACDLNNEDALRAVEREQLQLDQAFFVLSFAALENQITLLASARLVAEDRRTAMRDADFGKRWDASIVLAREILERPISWNASRSIVLSWYTIRSNIVHGRSPSQLADIPTILYRADEIASTSAQVHAALSES